MEYVTQRKILRCPIQNSYMTPWDLRDLDGGCQIWRRFQEKQIEQLGSVGDGAHYNQIKQFELTKIYHTIAESMWRLRMTGNADREYWWVDIPEKNRRTGSRVERTCTNKKAPVICGAFSGMGWGMRSTELDSTNDCAVEDHSDSDSDSDSDDDDDDNDNNSTIYSRDHSGSRSSSNHSLDGPRSNPISSADPYVTAPCTLASMRLTYRSFTLAHDLNDVEAQAEVAASSQVLGEMSTLKRRREPHPFLTEYVQQAWLKYEDERLSEEIENSRTLGWTFPHERQLSCCHWKPLRLPANLEALQVHALERPAKGRCAYERTPTIILTNENNVNFELREVIQILSDEEITLIHLYRDPIQPHARMQAHQYNYHNVAMAEGQSSTERHTVRTAEAWWRAQQDNRNANYIDRAHDEALSRTLLLRQTEREAEQYLRDTELSEVLNTYDHNRKCADQGQVEALARLKMSLRRDGLQRVDTGIYRAIGAPYSLRIIGRAWRTCLARGLEVLAVVRQMRMVLEEEDREEEGQMGTESGRRSPKRKWHRQQQQQQPLNVRQTMLVSQEGEVAGKVQGVVVGRQEEVREREAHREKKRKVDGEEEEVDWVAFMMGFVDDV